MKKALVLVVLGCLSVCEGTGSDEQRRHQQSHSLAVNQAMQTRQAQQNKSYLEQRGVAQQQRMEKEKLDRKHAEERAKAAKK